MANYTRPDATYPAIAENGGRASMSPAQVGAGWSTSSQTRPPADQFNARDYLTSAAIKYLCRLGVAEYSSSETYQGLGMCIGSNGSVYWNLRPSTGVDPVNDATGTWEKMPVRLADAQALISQMQSTLNFLTKAQADSLYMAIGSGLTPAQADATYLRITDAQASYATMQWVQTQLGNYATNSNAQTWANNAQNNAQAYADSRDQAIQANLQGQINSNNSRDDGQDGQIANLQNQINGMALSGSLQSNGWVKLPNGLIMQWAQGYMDTGNGNGNQQVVNFPTQFPTQCFHVQVSTIWSQGTSDDIMEYQINGWNVASVTVQRRRRGNDNEYHSTPLVFAIGI